LIRCTINEEQRYKTGLGREYYCGKGKMNGEDKEG
jgi:hypothetical protein